MIRNTKVIWLQICWDYKIRVWDKWHIFYSLLNFIYSCYNCRNLFLSLFSPGRINFIFPGQICVIFPWSDLCHFSRSDSRPFPSQIYILFPRSYLCLVTQSVFCPLSRSDLYPLSRSYSCPVTWSVLSPLSRSDVCPLSRSDLCSFPGQICVVFPVRFVFFSRSDLCSFSTVTSCFSEYRLWLFLFSD